MTIETILNSDMSVAYITDCATSPVESFWPSRNRIRNHLLAQTRACPSAYHRAPGPGSYPEPAHKPTDFKPVLSIRICEFLALPKQNPLSFARKRACPPAHHQALGPGSYPEPAHTPTAFKPVIRIPIRKFLGLSNSNP
jgi:hypothetical protein